MGKIQLHKLQGLYYSYARKFWNQFAKFNTPL